MADGRPGLFARPDAPHGAHDLLLVAAWAAGDAEGEDRTRAQALVEGCEACAELAADLRVVQLSAASLPAPARPRDFRLTREDAERLRPQGIRRFVAAVTHVPLQRAQPLAAGLTALGVAGLLVATVSFGGAAPAAPSGTDSERNDIQELKSERAAEPQAGALASPESTLGDTAFQSAAPAPPANTDANLESTAPPASGPVAPTTDGIRIGLVIGSALLVALGIGLFITARSRRRRLG